VPNKKFNKIIKKSQTGGTDELVTRQNSNKRQTHAPTHNIVVSQKPNVTFICSLLLKKKMFLD